MRVLALSLMLSMSTTASFAQLASWTCSEAQTKRPRELLGLYSRVDDKISQSSGRKLLAGSEGVVHSKDVCAAMDRRISVVQELVSIIDREECFTETSAQIWHHRLDEARDEKKGCIKTSKTKYTPEQNRQAYGKIQRYQQCLAAEKARGLPENTTGPCYSALLSE